MSGRRGRGGARRRPRARIPSPPPGFVFPDVPDELLLMIFDHLKRSELVRLARVCRTWTRVARERLFSDVRIKPYDDIVPVQLPQARARQREEEKIAFVASDDVAHCLRHFHMSGPDPGRSKRPYRGGDEVHALLHAAFRAVPNMTRLVSLHIKSVPLTATALEALASLTSTKLSLFVNNCSILEPLPPTARIPAAELDVQFGLVGLCQWLQLIDPATLRKVTVYQLPTVSGTTSPFANVEELVLDAHPDLAVVGRLFPNLANLNFYKQFSSLYPPQITATPFPKLQRLEAAISTFPLLAAGTSLKEFVMKFSAGSESVHAEMQKVPAAAETLITLSLHLIDTAYFAHIMALVPNLRKLVLKADGNVYMIEEPLTLLASLKNTLPRALHTLDVRLGSGNGKLLPGIAFLPGTTTVDPRIPDAEALRVELRERCPGIVKASVRASFFALDWVKG
ncbi:hypothetical protein MKEN_01300300 [Mycena kentingensis (nom. inval.)]|nr:hypothetical protein MKEN_01300300 [Mycena kentingensis (nom. inval.)]